MALGTYKKKAATRDKSKQTNKLSHTQGECKPGKPFDVTFDGVTKSASQHMIDITDSVDVQVAWSEVRFFRFIFGRSTDLHTHTHTHRLLK